MRDLLELHGTEDDNPVSVLVRRMQIPLIAGIGTGLALQASKGILETPATFGRIAYTTLPICGIGFYYLAGTYITERIRGKDSTMNHLIGAYCTFPVLRKFLPLGYTVSVLFFISLPLYVAVRGFKESENRLPFSQSLNYAVQDTGYNMNVWLQKKPSEPYVKRESYNIFTVPSK
ncbi:uncharacterized protein LOC126917821 isoform X2 [Bombus affinis]|nr:uncharacterized protein LOC126917821 isoform X2 [Bombus affinis]